MWYFSNLPPDKKTEARTLYQAGEFVALMNLYNTYRVSPDHLVPCCSINKMIQWTNWAISQGEI